MLINILLLSCVLINFYSDACNSCKDKKSSEQGSSSSSVPPKPPKPISTLVGDDVTSTSPVTSTPPLAHMSNPPYGFLPPISSEVGVFPSLRGKVFSDISTENKVNHYSIVKTTNGRDFLYSALEKIGINDFNTMESLLKNGDIICFKDDNAIAYDFLVIFFKKEKLEQQLINLSEITKINDCIYYCRAMNIASFGNDIFIGKLLRIPGSTEEEQLQKFFN